MEYTLYKLEFSTGLHIGRSLGGPSLDDGQMTIHSDTLFSALCCESLKGSKLADLYKAFAEGMLVISDALPCSADEIFLPKPVLYTGVRRQDGDPSFKKSLKSLGYIPLSTFDSYIGGLRGEDFDPADMKHDFGGMAVDTRVAIAGNSKPSPYNVAYWRFADDCGLYVVVGYED
jgi:CRISPR-associated protein Csm4